MTEKYLFHTIETEAGLLEALSHIAGTSGPLASAVLGNELPIDTICLFAQTEDEYRLVHEWIMRQGPLSEYTHGATTYVEVERDIEGQHITMLGVRQPDPTRPQRGYGDYPIQNYAGLLTAIRSNPYAHEITSGRGQSLIELRHPDFDILGYAFDAMGHD